MGGVQDTAISLAHGPTVSVPYTASVPHDGTFATIVKTCPVEFIAESFSGYFD